MKRSAPPRLATCILERILPARFREAALGDLVEEYAVRVETSPRSSAVRWFWSQSFRSIPSVVSASLRNLSWLRSIGIALAVYAVLGAVELVADFTITRVIGVSQAAAIALAPVVFLMASSIAGCVAARIRRGAVAFVALFVVITVSVLIRLKVCPIPVPCWYQFGFLILGPLAVLTAPSLLHAREK